MALDDCIFCRIVRNEIPSKRIDEDSDFICIRDIQPQAPIHFLVLPKQHVDSLKHVFENPAGSELVGKLFAFANRVANRHGLLPDGYRSVINTGHGGGQTVFHLHLHLLGGSGLSGRFG